MAAHVATLPQPGDVIAGRYQVIGKLGEGGMGSVYEVFDQKTARRRALKAMFPLYAADPDARRRFRLEVTVVAHIATEHLVEIFDADIDDATNVPFIVMELLRGEDLSQAIRARGPFSPEIATDLLVQVAHVLSKTHEFGVVHRDLKPANFFLTQRDDGQLRIRVLDFGIAKVLEEFTHGDTTVSIGTPTYMSPEQLIGADFDARTDLYSLGLVAYEMLVGANYWAPDLKNSDRSVPIHVTLVQGPTESAVARAAAQGITLPASFDTWFRKACNAVPNERFNSVESMVTDLARALRLSARLPARWKQLPRESLVELPEEYGEPPRRILPRMPLLLAGFSAGILILSATLLKPTAPRPPLARALTPSLLASVSALPPWPTPPVEVEPEDVYDVANVPGPPTASALQPRGKTPTLRRSPRKSPARRRGTRDPLDEL